MTYLLRHSKGELGPYPLDEWAAPNGSECLLVYMLRMIEDDGGVAELIPVKEDPSMPDYYRQVEVS